MSRMFVVALVLVATAASTAVTDPLPAIRVSEDGHFFVKADGTPFFWQGDTAWGIFTHASPDDVDRYLDDRAAKGFNVIQGVIALWDYNYRRNPDGQLPFIDRDFGQINDAYFTNVDAILDKVEARGMYMAILPFWSKNFPASLRSDENQQKLEAYHTFLARRYASRQVFWVLGGDASGALEGIVPYTDLMAEGLVEGARQAGVDQILITYHPTGRQSSAFWFHDRDWLDFDAIQSGHFIETNNFRLVADDFARTPAKPTIDMEPGYENITDRLIRDDPGARRIEADDVRRSAYLAVFAGAAGHTYGNGEVYEFWAPGKAGALPGWAAGLPWQQSLDLPGASQLQYVRHLIDSRPPLLRRPAPDLILSAEGASDIATERFEALRARDGSYAMVYVQQGKPVTVRLNRVSGPTIQAWWYDPRTGTAESIGQVPTADRREFAPPAEPMGADWVLVLDDANRHFPAPGTPGAGTGLPQGR